nr:MAG TPA: hypothetical protein [Caudoviricetes sp.]
MTLQELKKTSPRRGFLLWIPDANKTKCGECCGAYMFQPSAKAHIGRTTI